MAAFFVVSSIYSVFVYVVYPFFYDWGLFLAIQNRDHGFLEFLGAAGYCAVIIFFAGFVQRGIYGLFNCFLIFTTYIPFFMLMPFFLPEKIFSLDAVVYCMSAVLFSFVGVMFSRGRGIAFPVSLKSSAFCFFLVALSLTNLLFLVVYFRGLISVEAFFDVYAHREKYREMAGFASYFLHWQVMVLSPVALVFGLQLRSFSLVVLGCLGFIVVFMISSFKVALVVPFVVGFGYVLRAAWCQFLSPSFAAIFILFLFVSAFVFDYFSGLKAFTPYVADRVFLAHGVQNLMILDFFSDMPRALWGNSFLRHFVEPVYDVDPFIFLGQHYYGRDVRLNTGFVGDGFINFGVYGVILSTLVSAFVIILCDLVVRQKESSLCFLLFLPHFVSLLNGPVQVSLVTNGLLFFLLVLLLYPKKYIYGASGG
mgnify:CR=1 FL=1